MDVRYSTEAVIEVAAFADVLRRSTLAARRPVDDEACLAAMLRHANLLATAWQGDLLVGVARAVTDFAYCCYLSDLAVDVAYQRQGVGRALIEQIKSRLGPRAKIVLLAAPAAEGYYPKLGFHAHRSAWILPGAS
jgi:GNAT superfamily N-acetyltransferase